MELVCCMHVLFCLVLCLIVCTFQPQVEDCLWLISELLFFASSRTERAASMHIIMTYREISQNFQRSATLFVSPSLHFPLYCINEARWANSSLLSTIDAVVAMTLPQYVGVIAANRCMAVPNRVSLVRTLISSIMVRTMMISFMNSS